jgi:hypothetical protein
LFFRHDRSRKFDRRQQRRNGDGENSVTCSKPSIEFNPYNKAEGADVHVNTGDKVHQDADWDAGGANAKTEKHSKAEGGKAYSNGDQESESGHNKSDVDANTSAYQKNDLKVDMSQNGGRYRRRRRKPQWRKAEMLTSASIESVNLNDCLTILSTSLSMIQACLADRCL